MINIRARGRNICTGLNRKTDDLVHVFCEGNKPLGHVHIFSAGMGDLLVMLPYYKRLFGAFPCDRIGVFYPYNKFLFNAVFPKIPVFELSLRQFRYNPFYRMRLHNRAPYALVSTAFPVDYYGLETLSLFRTQSFVVGALRGAVELPSSMDKARVILNPANPLDHITGYCRRYFDELWKLYSGDDFAPDDSPAGYREIMRGAFGGKYAADFVQAGEKYICLSNVPTHPYRGYPREGWQKIADSLPRDMKIIHLGSRHLELDHPGYVDLSGQTTLAQAFSLVSNARLFVGVETGLLHAAYLSGVKSVCILGGGHFGHYLPWDMFSSNLKCVNVNMPCFRCNWKCSYVDLEKEEIPPCITAIQPEAVVTAIKDFGI